MQHLGDITKINGAEAPVVDCIIGGSPCFPAGTLVLTQSGYKPIEDIHIGELVYTHLGNWEPVIAIGSRVSPTLKMKGHHYGLIATPDHPFYSAEQEREWNNEDRVYKRTLRNVGQWTPAKEMEKKRWATPSKITGLEIPPFKRSPFERNVPILSRDFMYIVGRWLSDGWLRDGQRSGRAEGQTWGQVFICCARDETFYLETVLNDTFRNCGIKISKIDERTVTKFRLTSHTLVRWLRENFGERSTGKGLPSWVYCMERKYQLALLDGYFESDGHQYKRNTWKTTTVSKKLAFGMRMLGDVVGYSTAVSFNEVPDTKIIEGRVVHQKPFYIVSFTKESRRHSIDDGNYRWYQCRSVEKYSDSQTVYNITVDNDHSYIVEGYIVHNCQDLSIAGKRAGLAGERSGLYMDQIRIIKEMRTNDQTNGKQGAEVRPRYMLWENVPGAFSSNKGRDFAAVLEEAVGVVEQKAPPISVPKKGWPTAGVVMGDGWSIAWRVLDAQFWGVPQRRRRIALVADFGGQSAPEILFEREGVHGNYPTIGQEGETTASETETSADCTGGVSYAVRIRGGCEGGGKGALIQTELSGTLGCNNDQTIFCIQSNAIDRTDNSGCNEKGWKEGTCYTLNTADRHSIAILDMTYACDAIRDCGGIVPTLQPRMGTGGNQAPLVSCIGNGQVNQIGMNEKCGALNCMHDQQAIFVDDKSALAVRRLTPLECERLQGFPDRWTDIGDWVDSNGKEHKTKDTARYKALGNSIALPPWRWVLSRICEQYGGDHRPTMASLFDGIGGFPLIWEQLNGKGSCLWQSEIEEFPMAVTKVRFKTTD